MIILRWKGKAEQSLMNYVISLQDPRLPPVMSEINAPLEPFVLGVAKPQRGELYRFYSPQVGNGFYYVQWLNWATMIRDAHHVIVCPCLRFFGATSNVALEVIGVWSKGQFATRLLEIHDPLEKTIARALLRLAEKAVRREVKKGQIKFSDLGPILPEVVFHLDAGLDEWRLFVCCHWYQWEQGKVTWEARAADVREKYPHTKMTKDRLRRECAKDRLGLRA